MRALLVPALLILAGCSASELVQDLAIGPAPDLSEPNYRRIVGENIKTIFPNRDVLEGLEISGVRPVDHLTGRAWLTCLKLDASGSPQHYAIFIRQDKILDSRAGIVLDQCHKETYTPLTIPAGTKQPVLPRAAPANSR